MKINIKIILILAVLILLIGACITKFLPEVTDEKNVLVVDGMITDMAREYTVKLTVSQPLGEKTISVPVVGAQVKISDDQGNIYTMFSKGNGLYSSMNLFRGVVGRKYSVQIQASVNGSGIRSYESVPVELKPVPPIDSLYYEKVIIKENKINPYEQLEGCQVYLDTHDNGEECTYYRWGYNETWEFRIPWETPNHICWITRKSLNINVKNTSELAENRIMKYPLNFISNTSDRLSVKYSMYVTQYSMSQDEYTFWEKLKNVYGNVGGLYDMIPASIAGNMICTDDKSLPVLGYFSVSGESSRRIFIKDHFSGLYNPYRQCIKDTVQGYPNEGYPIPGLGLYVWIILDHSFPNHPAYVVLTDDYGCYDCTFRGTTFKPDFWDDDKLGTMENLRKP